MLVLIDCIGSPSIPRALINQIKYVGEIQEVKAVAYKSLSVLQNHGGTESSACLQVQDLQHSAYSNNLFILWLIHDKTTQPNRTESYNLESLTQDSRRVSSQIRFLQYIDEYCLNLFQRNKLNENEYFDEKMFNDCLAVIAQYYQLDPQLKLLFDNNKGKQWQKL